MRSTEPAAAPPVARRRPTPRRVLVLDRLADRVIRVGGTLVIVAIFGILVFLVAEVLPLFRDGAVEDHVAYRLPAEPPRRLLAVDEYHGFAVTVDGSGRFAAFHVRHRASRCRWRRPRWRASSSVASRPPPMAAASPSARSDGRVAVGEVQFRTTILTAERLPEDLVCPRPARPAWGALPVLGAGLRGVATHPGGGPARRSRPRSPRAWRSGIWPCA
ncbi:MAG: hypothetical protein RML12_05925 [Xanthomonadales bacterium]|nr:hypothetical protein [Xanthomonadales bacterium]